MVCVKLLFTLIFLHDEIMIMNPPPTLWIVVPTREGFSEYWLRELLKVKGQVEFILVHPPGAKPHPNTDPRMRQIVSALRGEIIQRITGLMNVVGDYVLTINCDEFLHPDVATMVFDYFQNFPDSWVLRLSKQGYSYGDLAGLEGAWQPIQNINEMKTCSKAQKNDYLFQGKNYLLEIPIAPLENKFNPLCLLGERIDQNGPHTENFDKKIWKTALVRPAIQEITSLMTLGGPLKYIPFWCLDRLLGLYIQAKFFETDKVIGHLLPLPEQIRVEDNPPEYVKSRRFYFFAEVFLLRNFPQYGYLWNLIIAQIMGVPSRAFNLLLRKVSSKKEQL